MAEHRMVHIRLPRDLHKRIQHRCVDEEISIQHYVLALIEHDMKGFRLTGQKRRK